MNQALIAAQQILTGLNDIQPIISVKGLTGASSTIKDMKKNAGVLLAALTPLTPRLKDSLEASKEDMNSSFKALMEIIPFDTPSGEITDEQMVAVGAAAETYAKRCIEFESCKDSYNSLVRHNLNTKIPGDEYASN